MRSRLDWEPVSCTAFSDAPLIDPTAVILASPAFSASYREIFLEFRGESRRTSLDDVLILLSGEWALIAFWATMSLSVGSTNL